MSPADGIRKLGFRRWYERQLIESHACFVTCFLCLILALASLEGLDVRAQGWASAGSVALVLGAGVAGMLALRRYRALLDRAEHIAERSTCPQCAEYGRIEVLASSEGDDAAASAWMRVRCRKCGHRWLVE